MFYYLLLVGLSELAVFCISLYVFLSWYKDVKKNRIKSYCILIGILYLILSILTFLWSFNFLEFNLIEYMSIKAIFLVIESILFLILLYDFTRNKNLFYLLSFFLFSVFVTFFNFYEFILLMASISYLVMLLVFLNFIFFSGACLRKAGYLGILYSITSLLFILLVMFGIDFILSFWFIPNILLFFIFFYIFVDIKYCVLKEKRTLLYCKKNFILSFIRYFVFVITISSFVMISLIAIHEMGHTLVAIFFGCDYAMAVIYETGNVPHAEIQCTNNFNEIFVILGGFILTIFTGLLFFVMSKGFVRTLSYLIFGFSILLAYGDLVELGLPINILIVVTIIGLIIVLTAIIKTSLSSIKQTEVIHCIDCLIK